MAIAVVEHLRARGTLILHEALSAREEIGCGLMFVSIVAVQLPGRAERPMLRKGAGR